jgi:thiol:disulfide interchange protein DsbA
MTENGVDGKKFIDVFKSFAVQTKVRQAKQLSDAYKVDGVPTMGVHGRYWTNVGMAGNQERTLQVVDFLVQKIRGK